MKLFGRDRGSASFAQEGDRLRDAGMWAPAAEAYAKHLEANPRDIAILVQAGNCLKDVRRYEEAQKRYRAALDLDPDNADIHLQYGHLMKLMGRPEAALESYRISAQLDPGNEGAVAELLTAGIAGEVLGAPEVDDLSKTIWLDVTDLIEYVKVNVSLSGIQRVVANLARHVGAGVFEDYRIIPVIPEYDRHRILAANPMALVALVNLFDAPLIERQKIDQALSAVYETRVQVWPKASDVFVVAGAFWIYYHYDVIRPFRKIGMRFGVFVHDLIQIKNPEYVAQDAVERFQKKLVDVLTVCDFVMTNSEFVASEVRGYLRAQLNLSIPVRAVVLATELRAVAQEKGRPMNDSIREMSNEEYVLCVATIEVRKNHMYQIRVWEQLIREFGERVPKLVWVGKWGWHIDELQEVVNRNGYVGDWLYIFNAISDVELEYLYKHCLFTIYTSFAEGFGLPIGESLVYGKPCIASNVTSMPEVGGRFVRYIDPWNASEGCRVVRDAIVDRAGLAEWAADIQTNFRPKTWNEFCDEFFSAAIEMSVATPKGPGSLNCLLPPNQMIEGGDKAVLTLGRRHVPIVTFRAARDVGWSFMEDWGVWSTDRRARLVFDSELPSGRAVKLYLEVRCPPESNDVTLTLDAGAGPTTSEVHERKTFVSCDGVVGESGRIVVSLVARGKFGPTPGRSCLIGLTCFSYCDAGDPLARIDMLEKVTLFGLRSNLPAPAVEA